MRDTSLEALIWALQTFFFYNPRAIIEELRTDIRFNIRVRDVLENIKYAYRLFFQNRSDDGSVREHILFCRSVDAQIRASK